LIIPSLISPYSIAALISLLKVTCYVLLAAVVSRTRLGEAQVLTLWICLAGSLLVSAGLTVIDFSGIVDIPYNNNLWIATRVGGVDVEQASGFFPRRSAMAAIYSISIVGSLVFALAHRSLVLRLFFLSAGSIGLLCVFLTHNRSGVLGSLAVIAVYTLVSPRFRGFRRIGIVVAGVVIGLILLIITVRYYPEHASIYLAKLGFIGLSETTWESDHFRIDLFLAAVKSIGTNPLGNGMTLVKLPGGVLMSSHNVVTEIIWEAGIFSLIWLPVFAATLYSYFSRRRFLGRSARLPAAIEYDAVSCALFVWLVNGMVHNTIHTGLAWILFGVVISARFFGSGSPRSGQAEPELAYDTAEP
jgi:hypothetical protein